MGAHVTVPGRYFREGLLDSARVKDAGEKAENLFVRLMLVADDFGRFDGRVDVIWRKCWPAGGPTGTDPAQQLEDVLERLATLTRHDLAVSYVVDGKPYIYLPRFKQRTRATKSKYPDPPTGNPQDDGPLSVKRQAEDGPTSVKWQAADGQPRAYSSSVSYSDSVQTRPGNSTSTPKAAAHSIARTQQTIAEAKAAEDAKVPMPPNVFESMPTTIKRALERKRSGE